MYRRTLTMLIAAAALLAPVVAQADPGGDGPSTTRCVYRNFGARPSTTCTPGALNPAVTQGTIRTTICVPGYTARIRPHDLHQQKLKAMRDYGVVNSREFEYDHLIPLELGGAPADPRNLWPEPNHIMSKLGDIGAYTKDRVENHLRVLVCAGTVTLSRAQQMIAMDWRVAEP